MISENIKIDGATTIYRTNKIIIKNPRKINDDMALEFYKISNIPEKSYYKVLAIVAIMNYKKTAYAILKDKINLNNIDEVLEEWNNFMFHNEKNDRRNINTLVKEIESYLYNIKNEYMKEAYQNKIKTHFKNKKVRKKFIEQINLFYEEKEVELKKYKKGDEVILEQGNMIHGSRISTDELYKIKENGLISANFYKDNLTNQKKPFCCEFWYIKEEQLLKDYLKKYTGGTILFKGKTETIEKIVELNKIEEEIKNIDFDYLNWEVYQTKEARFLPTSNNVNFAFILSKNIDDFLDSSIQSSKLDKNIKKKILPKWFYNKYIKNNYYDVWETDREVAILLGLPSKYIEGIIINEIIEKDKYQINKIKETFPNCYICNINGKVLL